MDSVSPTDRTARQNLVPVHVCPECGALEVSAYIGESSGAVVTVDREHFADERGFLYCLQCGAVWGSLIEVPKSLDIQASDLPPTIFAPDALGGGPGFNARDAGQNFRFFRKLGRTHARAVATKNVRAQQRASERYYDAEALSAMLELPPDIKAAITFHIKTLSEKADMRELCNRLREDGKIRSVRSEAVTIATIALVMERFNIHREGSLEQMLAAFRFNRGPPVITAEEYASAHEGCQAWFGTHIWKEETRG